MRLHPALRDAMNKRMAEALGDLELDDVVASQARLDQVASEFRDTFHRRGLIRPEETLTITVRGPGDVVVDIVIP